MCYLSVKKKEDIYIYIGFSNICCIIVYFLSSGLDLEFNFDNVF